jgi:hypothetical protein
MKCKLDLNGKSYESGEFTDRHVFTMVASVNAGGMNVRSLFEKMLGTAAVEKSELFDKTGMDSLFREFDMATADKNIEHILRTVFPTLTTRLNQLTTADLINITGPMLLELVKSEVSIEALVPDSAGSRPASPTPIDQEEDLSHLKYPPVRVALSDDEIHAIGHASRETNHAYPLVECWYQWWKAIEAVEGYPLQDGEAIDLIIQESGMAFGQPDSDRYHVLIQAYLQNQMAVVTA